MSNLPTVCKRCDNVCDEFLFELVGAMSRMP